MANALYGTCFNRRRNLAHISRSSGRNGHKSVRSLVSILSASGMLGFLWGSPRGICFCTEPQKLKPAKLRIRVWPQPAHTIIGHARAGALPGRQLLSSGGEHFAAGHSEVGTPHPAEVVSAYPQKFPSGRPPMTEGRTSLRAEQPLQAARTALCCPPTSCTLGRNCSRGPCSRNLLHFFNRQHGMGVGAACAHLRGNPNRLHQLLLRGAL